jgi:hypothetical protein
MGFDEESWRRAIFEALRRIDPAALYNVSLLEMDFRALNDELVEDFPAGELAQSVDQWLATLDPDAGEFRTEWTGGGVRLLIRARGRGQSWRGWTDMPSFNMLEPEIGVLHLTSGEDRRFIDLTLSEIDELASGEKQVVGQGASYQDTFQGIGHEMRHFGLKAVAELHPTVIVTYAGMLGLVAGPPSMGNYDATWSAMHRIPPNS